MDDVHSRFPVAQRDLICPTLICRRQWASRGTIFSALCRRRDVSKMNGMPVSTLPLVQEPSILIVEDDGIATGIMISKRVFLAAMAAGINFE
jgi:hypothetical protein